MQRVRVAQEGPRLRSLAAFVTTLSTAGKDEDILALLTGAAAQALDADTVSLWRWEPVDTAFCPVAGHPSAGRRAATPQAAELAGVAPLAPDRASAPWATGYLAEVGSPAPDGVANLLERQGKSSCIAVPVLLDGAVWGAIWATRAGDATGFGPDDLELAHLIAAQTSMGVRQAEHLAIVERLAYTDELTGLANRRAFEDRLEAAVRDYLTMGDDVGLIVLDVNGLKGINDRFGHQAGDAALAALAKVLADLAETAPGALAARLGGDEFAVLCAGAGPAEVIALGEALSLRAWEVLEEGVACGLALASDLPGSRTTPAQLLRAADAAQYRAKQAGIRVPVVAGRVRPETGAAAQAHDRRTFRDRREERTLLDHLLEAVDKAEATVLGRLSALAQCAADRLHATGWWVSELPAGGSILVEHSHGSVLGLARLDADSTYDVADFPATATVLAGAACHVGVDDPEADPAELALLTKFGLREMLMAGGRTADGRAFLVEVFGDEICLPLGEHAGELRAAVAVALSGAAVDG
jgi:diguanylate cyclase (GGDEF)-like protein